VRVAWEREREVAMFEDQSVQHKCKRAVAASRKLRLGTRGPPTGMVLASRTVRARAHVDG
jgi:hypothetical protein